MPLMSRRFPVLWLVLFVVSIACNRFPLDSPADDDSSPNDSTEDSPPIDTGPFDLDGDGWTPSQRDCDDNDPTIHPGAREVADGTDQNCNGRIDEGTELGDDDGDGFTEVDGDCDDADSDTFPDAPDYNLCDGVDRTCTGVEEPCASLEEAFAKVEGVRIQALAQAVAADVDMTGDGRPDVMAFNSDLVVWEIAETGGNYTFNNRDAIVRGPTLGPTSRLAVLGDTNQDGFVELAFANTGGRYQSYVYVVAAPLSGDADVESVAVAMLTDGAISGFGASLDAGRDASGDGVVDILVGAPAHTQDVGRAYLVSGDVRGQVSMDAALAQFYGDAVGGAVGAGVRFSGDNNGDGVEDVLIGGTGDTGQPSRVAWFAGPFAGDQSILDGDLVLSDPSGDLVGSDFAEAGDVDGDGREDLLLHTWDSCTGRVYVFSQVPAASLDEAVARIDDDDACGAFGYASSLPDANGDGLGDILVGNSGSQLGGYYIDSRFSTTYGSGAAALFLAPFGGVRTLWDAEAVWAGEHGADTLGQDVSNAGDFNGDGFEDFLLAAPYYGDPEDSAQAYSGAAYLMLGKADW